MAASSFIWTCLTLLLPSCLHRDWLKKFSIVFRCKNSTLSLYQKCFLSVPVDFCPWPAATSPLRWLSGSGRIVPRLSILYLLSTCSRPVGWQTPTAFTFPVSWALAAVSRVSSFGYFPCASQTATGGFSPASVPSVQRINPLLHLRNYFEYLTADLVSYTKYIPFLSVLFNTLENTSQLRLQTDQKSL